jgi:hypothetical protein
MSVTGIQEIWQGRRGSYGYKRDRSVTRVYEVETNSNYDSWLTLITSGLLPAIGTPYSTSTEADLGMIVTAYNGTQSTEDPRIWQVNVEYASILFEFPEGQNPIVQPGQVQENPLLRPPLWSGSSQKAVKHCKRDVQGVPIRNSLGEPIEGVERPYSINVFNLQYNVAIPINLPVVISFQDKTNDAIWTPGSLNFTFPKWSLFVDVVTWTYHYENNLAYGELAWTFLYDPELWRPTKLANQSLYRYKDGESMANPARVKVPNLDEWGHPVTTPIWLDVFGQPLPPDWPDDDAGYLDFVLVEEENFNLIQG